MTPKEAMIHQLKSLKGQPLKRKLEHIITYFWRPILITLVALVALGSYIVHLVNTKDIGLSVICLNAFPSSETTDHFLDDFAQHASVDTDKYQLLLNDSLVISDEGLTSAYETNQIIMARGTAKELDVIAGDLDTLKSYFYWEIFGDLREQLIPAQQEKYASYFLYIDMAVLREMEAAVDEGPLLPDPTKPELMEEPVPVALMLPEGNLLQEVYYRGRTVPICLGILGNTENLERALAFLDYITE